MTEDIRWKQRFQNFVSALRTLTQAIELSQQRPLSLLEKQGQKHPNVRAGASS